LPGFGASLRSGAPGGTKYVTRFLAGKGGLVARDVGMVAALAVQEALARAAHDRLAVGVVGFVERHRSLDHRDEDRAGMRVHPL
jgi:hypothetical protein